jgi:putative ABC transport system substrate-binding protein
MFGIKRREFITLLCGATAAWLLAARAQEAGRTYRLGVLVPTPRQSPAVLALFDELRLNRFIEGQNLDVILGAFEAGNEHLVELAAALVKAAPDAILAGSEVPVRTLQSLTRTIPLVGMTEDMVAEGLVASAPAATSRE